MKKKLLGLSFLFVLIALFISSNDVYGANPEDYLEIANANESVANTWVYGDYFYVLNDTDILKYYLEDGSLTDSYEIIDFMTSINKVLRKGYEVYIDMTYGGNRYFMCFDLRTFEEMNRTLFTNIDEKIINDDVWNYVYYEFDGHGFWLYGYGYGTVVYDYVIMPNMFKMSFDQIAPYENFGAVLLFNGRTTTGHSGKWTNRIYVYNTTSDSTSIFNKEVGVPLGQMVNFFSFSGVIYNVSDKEWVESGYSGLTTGATHPLNDYYGREDSFNMQHEVVIQDNGRMYTYATFIGHTIRGDLSVESISEGFAGDWHTFWYWDLDSVNDEVIVYHSHWGQAPYTSFKRAYNREGDGFGTWSTFNINFQPNFPDDDDKIGQASFGSYETYTGYDNLYIGYVNYTDLVPIAERIVLASGNDIVSSFDYNDVVECKIFNARLNLVAIFTRTNDPTLYVLRNLIDRDELARGGYTTPTLKFIEAKLYTMVGGQKILNDGWLFMGEVYQIEALIQNMTNFYLQLEDGENTIRFHYENETKSLRLTASDELVAGLIYTDVSVFNATLEQYNCSWRFILNKNIVDAYDIYITYYGENIPNGKTVSGTAISGLKIYNLGGKVYYEFNGDGGKVIGGDALELYATNGSDSSYAKADILFRKLQHTHLLVEIDFDNDFDGDHLDFPLGSGYVEFGFDYRLDGAWVTGWKAKIYVSDARVGRYGAGVDSSWVEITVDWYNKAHQAGIIKTEKIYVYHYGYDKDSDYAPRKSIMLWIDLWFNRMNASTVIGGRVNAYEHGMFEAGSTWWFGYGKFRPKIGNATASMFFDDLYDGSGDITNCKQFELIRMWAKVAKVNDADGNDDTWTLKNYEILNWKLADDRMEGVDTPVFVETKDPSMPKTGFISPLIAAIQGISTAVSKAIFNMLKLSMGAMDSLFEWFGFGEGFFSRITAFLGAIPELFLKMMENIPIMITNMVQLIEDIFGMVVRILPEFVIGIGYLTENIISYWTLLTSFFTGGMLPFNIIQDLQLGDWMRAGFAMLPAYEMFGIIWAKDSGKRLKERADFYSMLFNGLLNFIRGAIGFMQSFIQTIMDILPG